MNTPTTTVPAGPHTRPLLIAASIPSALSLAWTAWSVADMIPAPAPIAIAAGIALDVALVAAVAIAWVAPTIARGAQTASWITASIAAAAIAVHSWEISPALALMAAVPLISKLLWGLALKAKASAEATAATAAARAAEQEEKERAEADRKAKRLSVNLSEDEQAELAELERKAAFVAAKSAKELALAEAEAKAAQEKRLAEIRRQAETQMATDEATAQIHVRRAELAHQIQLAAPVYSVTELPVGGRQVAPQVPDDLSGLDTPPPTGGAGVPVAGFGFVQTPRPTAAARTGSTREGGGNGGTGADQAERPSEAVQGGGNGGIGVDQDQRAPHHAARMAAGQETRQRILAQIRQTGVQVKTAELARQLGMGRTTVRDHRNALRDAGYRVYPDSE